MALSDNNDSLPWMNDQSDWKNSGNFSQKLDSQYLNDDFSQDPAFAYSKVRSHNNSAIDGFYQELIKQSNNLTISTFRNDLMQHEARSRAAAKRRPEPPIVVNQILPGEEQRFLSNFLKQPFLNKAGIENMPYTQNANAYVYQSSIPNESLSNPITTASSHEILSDKRYRKKKNKKSSKNNSINVNGSNGISNNHESVQQDDPNTDAQDSESRQMLNTSNPVVYLEIAIDGEQRGTMIIELFRNVVPRTAENFRALCTGEHNFGYRYSYFHRIIPGFMCQAGDFEKSDGTGGYSIYGGEFADENFILKHDKPFLLSMANCGPGTNGSQFFITVTPCPHLDGKHVVFGQVLQGFHVVKDIEMCGTDSGEITREVKITKCGQIR